MTGDDKARGGKPASRIPPAPADAAAKREARQGPRREGGEAPKHPDRMMKPGRDFQTK